MRKLAIIFASFLFIIILTISLSWTPDKSLDELKDRWATAPSEFINIQNISTHVRVEGIDNENTPIVLIHGTSASLHTWEDWANELKKERKVISFDLPGFGLSGKFSDENYSIDNYISFLHQLLLDLQIEKAIIAGNSLGGQIAWGYSLKYPESVEKLVLIDSAGIPINKENMPIAWVLSEIPGVSTLLENVLPKPIVEVSVKKLFGDPSKVTSELVNRYYNITLHSGNRLSLQQRLKTSKSEDASQDIKKISHPTLLIWGSLDPLIPLATGKRFNQEIQGSKLVVLEGVGHMPQEESPIETIKILQDFLAN